MKAAPVMCALESWPSVQQTLVHTGQHYDRNLSDVFFSQLSMPEPDVNLEVGSGSHAMQTAEVMRRFEPVVLERKPDLVLVYGDVNSTVAAALVCSKLLIRVGHLSAFSRLPCNVPGMAGRSATPSSRYIDPPTLMTAQACGGFSRYFLK